MALARRVGEMGGTYPAVYNAANEVCVDAFHDRRIGFLEIVDTVELVVNRWHEAVQRAEQSGNADDVAGVLAADAWARDVAGSVIAR